MELLRLKMLDNKENNYLIAINVDEVLGRISKAVSEIASALQSVMEDTVKRDKFLEELARWKEEKEKPPE